MLLDRSESEFQNQRNEQKFWNELMQIKTNSNFDKKTNKINFKFKPQNIYFVSKNTNNFEVLPHRTRSRGWIEPRQRRKAHLTHKSMTSSSSAPSQWGSLQMPSFPSIYCLLFVFQSLNQIQTKKCRYKCLFNIELNFALINK